MPHFSFEPSESYQQALERAARMWGIEDEYIDTWGRKHHTATATRMGLLAALGIGVGTREAIDQAIEQRMWREWSEPLPPVVVINANARLREFAVNVPSTPDVHVAVEYGWEDGGARREILGAASALHTVGEANLRGLTFLRKQVALPETLPLGYHQLKLSFETAGRVSQTASTRLIVCPDRAYLPEKLQNGGKAAGIAIALYGLRSSRNWGCGDLTDLEEFSDWLVRDLGVSFVGLNPMHALANRQPYNISPYLPASVFYQNPIYIDVERVRDFQQSKHARRSCCTAEFQAEIEALRKTEFVEYERVFGLKMRALKFAFTTFLREYRGGSARAREFRAFVNREGDLLDRFAIYCALDEWMHKRSPEIWVWPDWPEEYRDPESEATRAFAKKHWRLVLFFKYVQWQLDEQLAAAQETARNRGMAIGLYHDLALATDRCGADLWAHRRFYVAGCRVGAPPDGFSPKGQDWAFPPPNSEWHRENGYRLFAETIRKNCRHGGALRFDHVMRFFRLYWIPANMEPDEGAYVRDHYRELLHILALESVRNKVLLVGEDLGTVTPTIRHTLERFGILGYKVPYFEKDRHDQFRRPQEYGEQSLVSSSTHDLPTFAGFWLARDVEARRACNLLRDESDYHRSLGERAYEKQKLLDMLLSLNLLPEWFPRWVDHVPEVNGELHNAFVGFLARCPSRLMVLNQEDLFKETEQQNLPATTWQYPNWKRKMRFAVEDLRNVQEARNFALMLRNWLERTGRMHMPPPETGENAPETGTHAAAVRPGK